MDWSKTLPVVGLIVSVAILMLILGGWFTGYGGLKSDVAHLAANQENGFDRVDRELKAIHDEIRMSKAEVIAAISDHEHDDQGKVFFRRPY